MFINQISEMFTHKVLLILLMSDTEFSGGNRARRGRRGKGRGRPASVKLEVKQEESVEVITGLAASESVETLKHQVCGLS